MKFSEAMLKGFEKVDGRQCVGKMRTRDADGCINAFCAVGAALDTEKGQEDLLAQEAFLMAHAAMKYAWGFGPMELNDSHNLPWEHIYGMARAVGQ